MRKFITLPFIALAGVTGCAMPAVQRGLPTPAPATMPACPAGEVVVHGDEPVGCNLIGGVNTLTILNITEAACDDAGGRWWYEACLDADF